jgi:hypothetical protein
MAANKVEDNEVLELEESEMFHDDEEHEVGTTIANSSKDNLESKVVSGPAEDEKEPELPFPEQDDEEYEGVKEEGEEGGFSPNSTSIPVPVQSATLPDLEQSTETASSSQNNKIDEGESRMGSLKTFTTPFKHPLGFSPKRLHSSEGDLPMAASLPARPVGNFSSLAFNAKPIKSIETSSVLMITTPNEEDLSAAEAADAYLGTSMPIRIPIMSRHRRKVSITGSLEGRPAPFIPPHLMESHASGHRNFAPGSVLSPSAAVKREKLMARNAILRSTGFIEVQNFAAPMSQVIDAVKETVITGAIPSPTVGEPSMSDASKRPAKAASSLTALLGN